MLGPKNSNSQLGSALSWYQKKIGSYDQQQWEKSIEERVLKGLSHAIPKKVARIKTELIDLDLIRGSAFTKAKPQQSCIASTYLGIVRVLLFPFYLKWWSDQTSNFVTAILFGLYAFQASSMYIYFSPELDKDFELVPVSEVISPLIMFFVLAAVQSQIASSHRLRSAKSRESRLAAVTQVDNSVTSIGQQQQQQQQQQQSKQPKPRSCRRRKTSQVVESRTTGAQGEAAMPAVEQELLEQEEVVHKPSRESHGDVLAPSQPPLVNKKASDEESGLDFSMDAGLETRRRSYSFDARRPRAAPKAASSSPDCRKSIKLIVPKRADRINLPLGSVSGEEGDLEEAGDLGDISSPDDISPYATVNSLASQSRNFVTLRQYSDMVTQRVRSFSHSMATSASSRRLSSAVAIDADLGKVSTRQRCKSFLTVDERSKTRKAALKLRLNSSKMTIDAGDDGDSSCQSECSLSPTTPTRNGGATTDMDWPIVNSDGTSEEEDEDEVATVRATTGSRSSDYFIFGENLDDPEHFPPSLFACPEELAFGTSRASDKKSDKGRRSPSVSCAIWVGNECQKVDLTVLDISSSIIRKVDRVKHSNEYVYLAVAFSLFLALVPGFFRLQNQMMSDKGLADGVTKAADVLLDAQVPFGPNKNNDSRHVVTQGMGSIELLDTILSQIPVPEASLLVEAFVHSNSNWLVAFVVMVSVVERFVLSMFFFFLLCVAERTYKERFLLSKYFCHVTSSRRARRSDLPHFRLNKVRNIKTWLSVRSYLKKHGPQRSINVIVSSSFIIAVVILTFLCMQLLRESGEPCSTNLYCWEMVSWNLALGMFIMRLIILGSKMNLKYKGNLSVLIAEQINLYLQLEQKPHKKEELTLANHVLKLAADLLKQLETPFKISGFSANHYLYNITKVVVLSAFSAVLTEMLGFKLKLHKIKL